MKKFSFCLSLVVLTLALAACSVDQEVRKKQAEASRNLGEAYMMENDYTSAYKELRKALELNPDDPFLHNDLGLVYIAREKPEEAIGHFKEAIKLNPDYAPAINNLGVAYMAAGEWDKAIETFKSIMGSLLYATPHYPLSNLGWAYYNKKKYRESVKYYKKALKAKPNYVIAMRGLGNTYIAMNRIDKAIEILEKGAKLTPRFVELQYDLAEAYAMSHQRDRALKTYHLVISLAPETPLAEQAQKEIRKLSH